MIDPGLVREVKESTTFGDEIVEQVLSMLIVLRMITEDPILRRSFVLIGGTAINLFDPKIPRLSVDLDLDYVHKGRSRFDQGIIENHSRILERIAIRLGMVYHRTTEQFINRLGASLYYKSNFTPQGEGVVKLDISYLMKTTVFPPQSRAVRRFHPLDGLKSLRVQLAHPCELWAGKALALVYRSNKDPKPEEVADLYSLFIARHLFDVSREQEKLSRRQESLDFRMLRLAFILKGVARIKELYMLRAENLRRCTKTEVERQLYPYLRDGNEPPLKEMKTLSRKFLDRVCGNSWNSNQGRFVEVFQEKGEYRPEILFGKDNSSFRHLYYNEYLEEAARGMVQ
ncbi:MAG: nucleotidyl transferase AbiEii/AbiGii toxin family protein [Candidatus Erginobacter occultus]|nr:nucleotidyl transferase AbiEii/AbiGii toxin family protein [Candidatus Erginobacter occultus]